MSYQYADRLIEFRKKAGLSQDELAEKLGVSRQAVSNWERGESLPDTENLMALAEIYDVSIDELLGFTRSKKSEENNSTDKEESGKKKKEKVIINSEGIFVEDEDDVVSISKAGIYVNSKDTGEFSTGGCSNAGEWGNFRPKANVFRSVFSGSLFVVTTIVYLILGFVFTNDNYVGWRVGWQLYLLAIVIYSVGEAIIDKKASVFAMPILATLVFCFMGQMYGMWHPMWCVFLVIPLYYIIVNPIEKYVKNKKTKNAFTIHIDAECDNNE